MSSKAIRQEISKMIPSQQKENQFFEHKDLIIEQTDLFTTQAAGESRNHLKTSSSRTEQAQLINFYQEQQNLETWKKKASMRQQQHEKARRVLETRLS